jgi:hypothetical protein
LEKVANLEILGAFQLIISKNISELGSYKRDVKIHSFDQWAINIM